MNVVVIHRPERTDREKFIISIIRYFKQVSIFDAIVPARGGSQSGRAIAGCSASHLKSISKYMNNDALLVLEDDAIINEQAFDKIISLKNIPQDCGAIILGADGLPEPTNIWTPITARFYGTQAVIYFPAILKSKFIETAWEILALSNVEGNGAVCYESILLQSIIKNGLKLYRPPLLAVTAGETVSDRSGKIEGRLNCSVLSTSK